VNLDALEAAVADEAIPQWLRTGLQRWAASGGAVSLTRCLALPCTPRQFALATRDHWLRIARQHVGSDRELARAIAGNIWRFRIWAERHPPAGAAPLLIACFNAWECAELPSSLKQLQRILAGHGSAPSVSGCAL